MLHKGTIRWTDLKKSCGFIVPDDNSKNIFIHISQFKKLGIENLDDGQRVWYELREGSQETFLSSIPELMVIQTLVLKSQPQVFLPAAFLCFKVCLIVICPWGCVDIGDYEGVVLSMNIEITCHIIDKIPQGAAINYCTFWKNIL